MILMIKIKHNKSLIERVYIYTYVPFLDILFPFFEISKIEISFNGIIPVVLAINQGEFILKFILYVHMLL